MYISFRGVWGNYKYDNMYQSNEEFLRIIGYKFADVFVAALESYNYYQVYESDCDGDDNFD